MHWNSSPTLHPNNEHSTWVAKLRSLPAAVCPSENDLSLFAREPLSVADDQYTHIVRGCSRCRRGLHRLLLDSHPTSA